MSSFVGGLPRKPTSLYILNNPFDRDFITTRIKHFKFYRHEKKGEVLKLKIRDPYFVLCTKYWMIKSKEDWMDGTSSTHGDMRNVYNILGKFRRSWEDNIQNGTYRSRVEGVDWIQMTHWRAYVNEIINLRLKKKKKKKEDIS
jgi:hypothetical protein